MDRKAQIETTVPGYEITIQGRHVEVTDPMKTYAMEKISKMDRFTDRIIQATVTMDIQKLEHRCDIVFHAGHLRIRGHAACDDMYAAIDKATDRIERQLRRYKTKIQHHQGKALGVVDMNVNVFRPHSDDDLELINDAILDANQEAEERELHPNGIVAKEVMPLKTLSYNEAIMKMELSQDPFMLFRSEEDQKLKLIYRRDDENYGVMEPE